MFLRLVLISVFIFFLAPIHTPLAENPRIRTAVDTVKELCLSGDAYDLSVDAHGKLTFKKLTPGAEGSVSFNIRESTGATGYIDEELKNLVDKDIRDCIKPFIPQIMDAVLGKVTVPQGPHGWCYESYLSAVCNKCIDLSDLQKSEWKRQLYSWAQEKSTSQEGKGIWIGLHKSLAMQDHLLITSFYNQGRYECKLDGTDLQYSTRQSEKKDLNSGYFCVYIKVVTTYFTGGKGIREGISSVCRNPDSGKLIVALGDDEWRPLSVIGFGSTQ